MKNSVQSLTREMRRWWVAGARVRKEMGRDERKVVDERGQKDKGWVGVGWGCRGRRKESNEQREEERVRAPDRQAGGPESRAQSRAEGPGRGSELSTLCLEPPPWR